jgi:hypothetical protein
VAFSGDDFLAVAQALIGGTPTEGELRSAIGRVYCGAFLHARAYCWQRGDAIDQTGRAHEQVRQHFQRQLQRQLAADLLNLHLLRKNADYDLLFPKPNLAAEAVAAVQLAAMIIGAIEALS